MVRITQKPLDRVSIKEEEYVDLTVANRGRSMAPISPAFTFTGLPARVMIILNEFLICGDLSYQLLSYAARNTSPL